MVSLREHIEDVCKRAEETYAQVRADLAADNSIYVTWGVTDIVKELRALISEPHHDEGVRGLRDHLGAVLSDLIMVKEPSLGTATNNLRRIIDELPKDQPITGTAPRVAGKCPGCGAHSLFLGKGGHVTCAIISCSNPGLVDQWLYGESPAPGAPELLEDEDGAPFSPKAQEVWAWWQEMNLADFMKGAPKIGEYTAADLEIMGVVMEKWGISAADGGMEAATLWYILGKVARAVAAYREGRLPSEDTLHDITYYSMMARRIRATGDWP